MPDTTAQPCPEISRLRGAITSLAEILTRLTAAQLPPGHGCDLHLAPDGRTGAG